MLLLIQSNTALLLPFLSHLSFLNSVSLIRLISSPCLSALSFDPRRLNSFIVGVCRIVLFALSFFQ